MRLWKPIHKTANYKVLTDKDNGYLFRFYCDISGALVYTTEWIKAEKMEDALNMVWEKEGRKRFNRCSKCGKWVADIMFNADVLECVVCTPWEDIPQYCSNCGKRVYTMQKRCSYCGAYLRYEGR